MYTMTLLLALQGAVAQLNEPAPQWQSDYAKARAFGKAQNKPLAVFVGSGKEGWNKLADYGKLGTKVDQVLSGRYVCVYVDVDQPKGKKLAQSLSLGGGVGIVISDATGSYMAFYHEGDLTEAKLVKYLHRYSDPNREVVRTDTNPDEHHAPRNQYRYRAPVYYGGGGC